MSDINLEKISIVHWYPELEKHKCGYCKKENSAVSYGMWAEQLSVEDYQQLVDRGWRRSGMYCYKAVMEETCCPLYTIRSKAVEFQPSKSHKKIIKRFNKFINDGVKPPDKILDTDNPQSEFPEVSHGSESYIIKERPALHIDLSSVNKLNENEESTELEPKLIPTTSKNEIDKSVVLHDSLTILAATTSITRPLSYKPGLGADPTKPPCKKAKLIRLEKHLQKVSAGGMHVDKRIKNESKTLEQFLNEIPENSKYKLKIDLVGALRLKKELDQLKLIEFELYKKYQMAIHSDPPEKCTISGFTRFLLTSPLKIKHERVNSKHPNFKVFAALYKKYQMAIHNEPVKECSERMFCDFLVNTPLKTMRLRAPNSGVVTYGTFHQQYWLDNKLIAVAVLDILPYSVSSVYFFYDPDYKFLRLGTYGALREIQYVQSLHKIVPAIEYYNMGFYIHSCPKMRYKAQFNNSFLLCPETFNWFPLEKCILKFETNKYARLTDDLDAIDENECSPRDIDNIKICTYSNFILFGNYKTKYGQQDIYNNIGKLVGKKCASTLLFVSAQ